MAATATEIKRHITSGVAGGRVSTTIYTPVRPAAPRKPRRRRRLRLRHVVAASLVVCAGSVAMDALTPAAPVAVRQVASVRDVDFAAATADQAPAWRPRVVASSSVKSSHHVLSKLLMVHRLLRVHRVFRIHRPFWRLRRWFR